MRRAQLVRLPADPLGVALNPSFDEQQLLANARARQTTRLSPRERRAEMIVGGTYVLAALATRAK